MMPMMAPPTSTISTHPTQQDQDKKDMHLARLRNIRAEVQDLRLLLENVRKGQTTIKGNSQYLAKTKKDIAALVADVGDTFAADVKDGDTFRHVQNIWEQMLQSPFFLHPEQDMETQEQLHSLDMLDQQIRQIEFHLGVLCIPARVNDWLAQARPGYYIPFHVVFEDEVPTLEDRVKILSYLASSPKVIKGGIVDAANGLIYRCSKNPKRSIGLLIIGLVISTGLVAGACYLPAVGWPLQREHLSMLMIGWGAILVGMVVHIAVGDVKRTQRQGEFPPVAAVSNFLFMLDARSGQILQKLALALIGIFGLVFASGVNNVTPVNAFLVGYSLDSVIEVFSASLEQQTQAQVTAIKKQLGVTSE